MSIIKGRFNVISESDGILLFRCPGCNNLPHQIRIKQSPNKCCWGFNNDFDKPTFTPSYLLQWIGANDQNCVCHSFITDGNIQFLNDCTHDLAGQTIEIPQW